MLATALSAGSPAAAPDPDSLARLPDLLRRLVQYGFDLAGRLAHMPGDAPPGASATHPARSARIGLGRIERAITWALALVQVLTGVRRFTDRARPAPAALTGPAPLGPERFASERHGLGPASDRAMRRAFATQPIGQIVAGICQDLAIDERSELWPAELIALTQTPAEWAGQRHAPVPPRPGAPDRPTAARASQAPDPPAPPPPPPPEPDPVGAAPQLQPVPRPP